MLEYGRTTQKAKSLVKIAPKPTPGAPIPPNSEEVPGGAPKPSPPYSKEVPVLYPLKPRLKMKLNMIAQFSVSVTLQVSFIGKYEFSRHWRRHFNWPSIYVQNTFFSLEGDNLFRRLSRFTLCVVYNLQRAKTFVLNRLQWNRRLMKKKLYFLNRESLDTKFINNYMSLCG